LGANDGRIVLVRREQLPFIGPSQRSPDGEEELDAGIRQHLLSRGASFFADLVGASGAGVAATLAATWRLTWSGQVTNDTLAPMRALSWTKREVVRSPRGRGSVFPPEAGGRWSAICAGEVPATQRAHALATALLDRYGVVTRETVSAEGIPGGFAAVYPVLKAMEESGRVRRGYFIEGLGGAQFALPGAVDALRHERESPPEPVIHILAATDPASPWGASLAWPRREESDRRILARAPGASVVLVDGEPVIYVERGGKGVCTLPAFDDRDIAISALQALRAKEPAKAGRPIAIERIDGVPASESYALPLFGEAGFVMGYRGLTPARDRAMANARG
jgi:ATP-dependent Lhr-like helicase